MLPQTMTTGNMTGGMNMLPQTMATGNMTGGMNMLPQTTFGNQITGGANMNPQFGLSNNMTGGANYAIPQTSFGGQNMVGAPQTSFGGAQVTGGMMPMQRTGGFPGNQQFSQVTGGFQQNGQLGMPGSQYTGQPAAQFGNTFDNSMNNITQGVQNTSISQPPLQTQPTGFGFGNAPQQQGQQQARQANLFNATADNPFGF